MEEGGSKHCEREGFVYEREGGRGRNQERTDAIFGEKGGERRHATPTGEPARVNVVNGSCELVGGRSGVPMVAVV